MDRTMIAVPEITATQVDEIREKIKKETGIQETKGRVVAIAVAEFHKKELTK